jgi:ferric-dicitrate binding protein FerR (iron transport regulator)
MPARIEILFQKFMEGTCSKQEYDELMDLLQQNQHEEQVRAMLSEVYKATARSLPSGIYVDTNGDLQKAYSTPVTDWQPPVRRRRTRVAWLAAALVILLAGAWFLFRINNPSTTKQVIAESSVKKFTQRAEQKYVLLPDSTQVWLNVASTVEFPESFQSGVREVWLVGEAYFDVKHAEEIPFIIHTSNVTTRVLGTAFNIKAYPDQTDVVVSVKRGRVQVSKNNKVVATLTVGQQIKIGTAAVQATVLPANENKVAEWTNGRLTFESLPFIDILKDLERNYNVNIELTDSTLNKVIVTTSFRRDIGVEQALDILCGLTSTQLQKENGQYILHKK